MIIMVNNNVFVYTEFINNNKYIYIYIYIYFRDLTNIVNTLVLRIANLTETLGKNKFIFDF